MKQVFFLFVLAMVCATVRAQDKPHPSPEEHLKRSQEMLQKELNMNSDQQQKVEQAFREFMTAAEKLHADNPPPPPPPMDPKVKEAMDKLVQQRDAQVKQALTAAQYKKYLELAGRMHRPPPPPQQAL